MPKISGKRAELFGHRVPDARGDEIEAESADRQPGAAPELVDQEREQDRDRQRGQRQQRLEDPVAVVGSLERGGRGRPAWVAASVEAVMAGV